MAANNEVGTIYPIEDIVEIVQRSGAQTLIDATQAAGRIPIEVSRWGITYLTLSAHKIYGPKGVGALIAPPSFQSWTSQWIWAWRGSWHSKCSGDCRPCEGLRAASP